MEITGSTTGSASTSSNACRPAAGTGGTSWDAIVVGGGHNGLTTGAYLARAGLRLVATRGTAAALSAAGLQVEVVNKVAEGGAHVADLIRAGGVDLVINTPRGRGARADGLEIRQAAIRAGVPCITTIEAAEAAAQAIRSGGPGSTPPVALQDLAGALA